MSSRAHLLLQVEPGRAAEVTRYVGELPDISEAAQTSGPFDVIAVLDAASEAVLARTLTRVRRAPGLWAVRVCRAA